MGNCDCDIGVGYNVVADYGVSPLVMMLFCVMMMMMWAMMPTMMTLDIAPADKTFSPEATLPPKKPNCLKIVRCFKIVQYFFKLIKTVRMVNVITGALRLPFISM